MSTNQETIISPSASGVAYLRAVHEDISGDFLAKYFVAPEGETLAKKWLEAIPCVGREVALRCRWFDSEILAAINAGIKQIVQIAAGLSTFPWRHPDMANLRYAEFDREEMIRFKKQAIGKSCNSSHFPMLQYQVEWRPIDLAHDNLEPVFRSLSWNFDRPTLFVLEGISYYLPTSERFAAVLEEIKQNVPKGSRIAFDYFHNETEDLPALECAMGSIASVGGEATWRRASANEIRSLLSEWTIMTHESLAKRAEQEGIGKLMDYVSVISATKI